MAFIPFVQSGCRFFFLDDNQKFMKIGLLNEILVTGFSLDLPFISFACLFVFLKWISAA